MLNVIKGFTQMNQKNSLQYNPYAKNLGTMHKYNILCLSLAYFSGPQNHKQNLKRSTLLFSSSTKG